MESYRIKYSTYLLFVTDGPRWVSNKRTSWKLETKGSRWSEASGLRILFLQSLASDLLKTTSDRLWISRVYLGPGGGVPFEARPLKAGGFLFGLLAAAARLLIKDLELSSADADAQDDPPFHSTPTGGVALQNKAATYRVIEQELCWLFYPWNILQCPCESVRCGFVESWFHPLPVLAQPVWSAVPLPAGLHGQRLVLRGALVLRNHPAVRSFTVHVTNHLPMAAGTGALQRTWVKGHTEENW